jgi:hypothetical protein
MLYYEDLEPRFFGQSSESYLYLDKKVLKIAKGKFYVWDYYSSKNILCENSVKGERGKVIKNRF